MESSKNANQHAMNVSFLKDDPLNSVIIDTSNGKPLYEVRTPSKVSNRTTNIRRLKPGVSFGEAETIAEVQWRKLGSSTITLHGATVRIKDWLRKDGIFTSSRILTTSDGKQYKWTHGSDSFTLKDTTTNVEAAWSHGSKTGWSGGTPRKMNIDISPRGMYILDTIIVSFIIMEEKDRQVKSTKTAVVILGGGNTVAVAAS